MSAKLLLIEKKRKKKGNFPDWLLQVGKTYFDFRFFLTFPVLTELTFVVGAVVEEVQLHLPPAPPFVVLTEAPPPPLLRERLNIPLLGMQNANAGDMLKKTHTQKGVC